MCCREAGERKGVLHYSPLMATVAQGDQGTRVRAGEERGVRGNTGGGRGLHCTAGSSALTVASFVHSRCSIKCVNEL